MLWHKAQGAGGVGGFSPASLFASGESGAWYDPSDLSTMWTDTSGTTSASVGDSIARIDDKSGNGFHATQATLANRPVLRQSGSLYYLDFSSNGYLVAGTNSDWNYLHDGTGCEWVTGLRPHTSSDFNASASIFATHTGTTRDVGNQFVIDDRSSIGHNDQWRVLCVRGVSNSPVFSFSTNNTISNGLNSDYVVRSGHGSAESPQAFLYENGVSVYSSSYSTTPSTANSKQALVIGKTSTSSPTSFSGYLYGQIFLDRVMTTSERIGAEAYMADKSGVTL